MLELILDLVLGGFGVDFFLEKQEVLALVLVQMLLDLLDLILELLVLVLVEMLLDLLEVLDFWMNLNTIKNMMGC